MHLRLYVQLASPKAAFRAVIETFRPPPSFATCIGRSIPSIDPPAADRCGATCPWGGVYTANSALLFTNALIYEGSPYYESDKRLKEAEALSTYETALMFKYLRRYKKQTGHSLLLSILADQSAVKNKVKLN